VADDRVAPTRLAAKPTSPPRRSSPPACTHHPTQGSSPTQSGVPHIHSRGSLHSPLDDGALRLPEALLRIAAGGVGHVDGVLRLHADVILRNKAENGSDGVAGPPGARVFPMRAKNFSSNFAVPPPLAVAQPLRQDRQAAGTGRAAAHCTHLEGDVVDLQTGGGGRASVGGMRDTRKTFVEP